MQVFILPIGDWSKSGHNLTEYFVVSSNKTKDELIDAYHKSVDMLDLTLDKFDKSDAIKLLTDCDEPCIKESIINQLESYGANVEKFTDSYAYNGYYSFNPEQAAKLFMEFVKISLPELKYEFVDMSDKFLFGHNGRLDIHVGYGTF